MYDVSQYLTLRKLLSIFMKSKAVSEEWAHQHRIRYGVEALGKELGQLSSDIDVPKELSTRTVLEPGVIVVALLLAKKIYLCGILTKFVGDDGRHKYFLSWTVRMKGVSLPAVIAESRKVGGLLKLYECLAEGTPVTFDLCEGSPGRQRLALDPKSQRYHLISSFKRSITIR